MWKIQLISIALDLIEFPETVGEVVLDIMHFDILKVSEKSYLSPD